MAELLTPQQAADVIKYYHDAENAPYRQRGFSDKVSLGLSALHAAQVKHSILPDGSPTLTLNEMNDGLQYQPVEPTRVDEGSELSWQQQRRLDALMDGSGFPYDLAVKHVS